MTGLRAVAALRFREALAGRMLWLLPLHFAIAFAVVRTLPGPTLEARLQAADATALGLAAVLGLVAAAVMGASPLAAERLRPRGTLVLAAPVPPAARVLGTALGTGGALLLLVSGLCASAMAAVDLGVGGATENPVEVLRAEAAHHTRSSEGSSDIDWTYFKIPRLRYSFPRPLREGEVLVLSARAAVLPGGTMPTSLRASFQFQAEPVWARQPVGAPLVASTPVGAPFRVAVPAEALAVEVTPIPRDISLGCRIEDVRVEAGRRSRALARGLHAAALLGGLLAVMGAAMALSTVTGAGVGAGGALALAMLSLSQPLFADAAETLAHAGAMERALQATLQPGQVAVALTGTPPALAPVFRAVAAVLPDGTRFDLASGIAANEVPWSGDVVHAVGLGLVLCAAFLAAAVLGARRRP